MIIHAGNYRAHQTGNKARNLFRLAEYGCPVPPFFCVDSQFDEQEALDYLDRHFPDTALFSVRSSASTEDGTDCSFAGQFQTLLRVRREDVCASIRQVLSDTDSESIRKYCRLQNIEHTFISMYVIVQEMVEADRSGILFTANPQGILNETVIVLGAGTGDQVVEDRTDTTTYYYNRSDGLCYYEQAKDSPLLAQKELDELILISGQIRKWCGTECDLEYALKDQTLWLLQMRPVTALQKDGPVIILDNSNIVESYPGLTLPLTMSFIREAYYQVFKHLLFRLTGESGAVQSIDHVLKHMVDMANGRVYYRISNWYDVLLFLPFHQKIIPVWQEMMGVGDRAVSFGLKKPIPPRIRRKVARSFFRLLLTCPKEMEQLDGYFTEIIRRFEALDTDSRDNRILLNHYRTLMDLTVRRWDITLVNDMYSFLFTGLLKAYLKARRVPEPERTASRAVSGIRKLESLGPIRELNRLGQRAKREGRIARLQQIRTRQDYMQYVRGHQDSYTEQLEAYIRKFGDRNVEELKLESRTFRTNPELLIQRILRYTQETPEHERTGGQKTARTRSQKATRTRRQKVACTRNQNTTHIRLPDRLAVFLAGKAALGIRNREKSRLNRSRLYGMMRALALRMGENLYRQKRIGHPRDIFWLDCDEIAQAADDPQMNLRQIILERKEQYEGYETLPAWSRLVFLENIKNRRPKNVRYMTYERNTKVWHGTACSPGIAEGEVLLVHQPSLSLSVKNRILVSRMTDPGWVYLLADAGAVLSEKGSLLSHTAIISRELGKPAVVGIPRLMETLRDGDRVRVDGDTGTVTLLS